MNLFDSPAQQERRINQENMLVKLRNLYQEGKVIYINHNVASLKNSRRIFSRGKKDGDSSFIINLPSSLCEQYVHHTRQQWINNRAKFLSLVEGLPKPYIIGFYLIRSSNTMFDFFGPMETILDIMSGSLLLFTSSDKWKTKDSVLMVRPPFTIPGHEGKVYDIKNKLFKDKAYSHEIRKDIRWIEDDDAATILPVPLGYHVDNAKIKGIPKAGVLITVITEDFFKFI